MKFANQRRWAPLSRKIRSNVGSRVVVRSSGVMFASSATLETSLRSEAAMSGANNNHLSRSLIGLHDAMSFANFIEAEDPRRLHVEPTGSGIFRDLLEGHI